MNNQEIEQHLAWQGMHHVHEVVLMLEHENPFTYILSQDPSGDLYHLSYCKKTGQKIHIPFKRVKQGYRNGSNTIFSTLDNLIRYKLKGRGSPLKQVELKLSA